MGQQQPPWPFVRIHHRWRTLGAEQQQSAPSAAPGRITLPGPPHEEQISARASPVTCALLCRRPRARGACGMVVSGTRERAPLHSGPAPGTRFIKIRPCRHWAKCRPWRAPAGGRHPPHGAWGQVLCCGFLFWTATAPRWARASWGSFVPHEGRHGPIQWDAFCSLKCLALTRLLG